jgi:uncharacterized protein YecE (DUF72 family)
MAQTAREILVGTSGWSYRSWRGPFFPEKLAARLHLQFYAEAFPTTELNGVFYRTPTEEAVSGWAEQTPDDFVFAWKASKFITHWKRLKDTSRNSLELLESRLRLLRGKAGPVLFQLPPQFTKNRERLAAFLKMLRVKREYAFEFRHPSWYEDDNDQKSAAPKDAARLVELLSARAPKRHPRRAASAPALHAAR